MFQKSFGISLTFLDIDLCGPSQPRIMGCEGEGIHQSGSGWSPVFIEVSILHGIMG